jgi:restriction system protein
MALPTFDQFMLPVLDVLAGSESMTRKRVYAEVAGATHLSEEDMALVVPSGQLTYQGRIGWAITDLMMARALARPARATYAITERGRELLAEGRPINRTRLMEYPEFAAYQS